MTEEELAAAGLAGWRVRDGALEARFATGDYATALELTALIGAAAEAADHHPDLLLRYGSVEVRTWSHDVGAITERDRSLARRITELAAEIGAVAAHPAPDG
jgi:4a-hydroxytetrahydrobiopterin dehydratase